MSSVFHGDRTADQTASGLTSVYSMHTPPPDREYGPRDDATMTGADDHYQHMDVAGNVAAPVVAWLEIWDFAGGASFRAFVTDDGQEKTLFVFFDGYVVDIDLKEAYVLLPFPVS